MLTIRIERKPAFATEKEAIDPLAALAGVLASATRSGMLWARFRNALLPFDAGTVEPLLSAERSLHAHFPERATHIISLCATPEGPGEVGVVSVNVRPGAKAGATPGLALTLSLPQDSFDLGAASLRRLLEACIDAVSADVAVVGPDAWLRELGVGWATFARRIQRDLLPAGAVVIATRTGSLILAHTEDPASESASAHDAITRVHAAIHGERSSPPSPPPSPPSAPPSVIAPLAPTYLAAPTANHAPPPRHGRAPAELRGTLDPVDIPRGPALPFIAGALSVLSTASPTPPPRRGRAPAELRGTLDSVDTPRGPALPFVGAAPSAPTPPDPIPIPDLTVEQYARLRAQLTVKGEDDLETWWQFGVMTKPVKDALQAHFAARFREDPAARERFVELVQQHARDLRDPAPKR